MIFRLPRRRVTKPRTLVGLTRSRPIKQNDERLLVSRALLHILRRSVAHTKGGQWLVNESSHSLSVLRSSKCRGRESQRGPLKRSMIPTPGLIRHPSGREEGQ
jgi:hypothetical protein